MLKKNISAETVLCRREHAPTIRIFSKEDPRLRLLSRKASHTKLEAHARDGRRTKLFGKAHLQRFYKYFISLRQEKVCKYLLWKVDAVCL
ncbi:hypothetical protein CW705_05940 [Candidatus Bathyarchaeota archaeon]|nr:MAG: hypothetical protein CW705_05940 [Candidatus Bathyarchaeota archaeon]